MRVMLANLSKMVGDAGGLAKVTSSFANEMIARGHSIGIVHSDEEKNDFFYTTDCQVQLYNVRNINGHILKYPAFYKIEREFARLFSKKKQEKLMKRLRKSIL